MSETFSTLESLKEQFRKSENKRNLFDFGIVYKTISKIKNERNRFDFGTVKRAIPTLRK